MDFEAYTCFQFLLLLISGFIFDFRESYDDVFVTIGCVYILDTFLFAMIAYLQHKRARQAKQLDYNEISGIVGSKQTFKISTKRSVSKSSLVNEDEAVPEYGTTENTGAWTPKTPPGEHPISNGSVRNPYDYSSYPQQPDRTHQFPVQQWQ